MIYSMENKKKLFIIAGIILAVVALIFLTYRLFFSAPQSQEEKKVFIVNRNQTETQTFDKLKTQGLIRNKVAFKLARFFKKGSIEPGGYNVSKNMSVWQLAEKLTFAPDMKWVVIPEGYRRVK